MSTPPSLRYQHGTDLEFAQRAAATFALEDFGSALVLSGPCPRCGQEMDFMLSCSGTAPARIPRPAVRS